MTTDLAHFIQESRLSDTHEHMNKEKEYVEAGPDILQSLFENYVLADLVVAGASHKAVVTLHDGSNPDLRARFLGVQKAWELVKHTGYGGAVDCQAGLQHQLAYRGEH